MADEKPKNDKPAPAPQNEVFTEIAGFILVLVLLSSLLNYFQSSVGGKGIVSRGLAGWSKEAIYLSHTRPVSELANPIGVQVMNSKESAVYDSPGGRQIGKHSTLDRGTIVQGPVDINGVRYWYVDYDEGPDGWVNEADLAYITGDPTLFERIIMHIVTYIGYLKIIIILFSIACAIAIYILLQKVNELLANEKKMLYPKVPEIVTASNPQWERIVDHSESVNENDWRLAIIEADIMLGELLEKMDLPGDSIGDKLKYVEKSDFTTLDNVWEAHKARNRIAHEGSGFVLNQHEAKKIINLYRSAFEEFEII